MYTGGALMFMLDGCGYTDNSGGGGGHYWDLDPVLTPFSPPSPSPSPTSNTNVGTPTLKGMLPHSNFWLNFHLASSVHLSLHQHPK